MNIKEAMWSSFYDDIDKITQIVRGAHAMDSELVVLIEFHHSDWVFDPSIVQVINQFVRFDFGSETVPP